MKTYLGIASFFGEFPTHLVPGRWDLVEVRHSNTRWRCRYMTIPMRYYTLIGSDITQMVFLCRCLRADAAVVNTWAWSHINGAMVLGCIVPRHRLYVRKCIRAEFWINMKLLRDFESIFDRFLAVPYSKHSSRRLLYMVSPGPCNGRDNCVVRFFTKTPHM